MRLVSWHVLSRDLYRTVSCFFQICFWGLLWRWCFFSFGIFTFKPGRELWLLWLLCPQRGSNHGSNSSSNPGSRWCWLHMPLVMHLTSVARCEGSMAKGLMQSDPVIFCCLRFMLEVWDLACYWPALAGGPGPPTSPKFGADTGLDFSPPSKHEPTSQTSQCESNACSQWQSAPMGGVSAHHAGLPSRGRSLT